MKKFFKLALLGAMTSVFANEPIIAITQIVEHPSLDLIRDGIIDGLKETKRPLKFEYESANGNMTTALQIAERFVGMNATIIVAVGTPSSQAAINASGGKIPVIFAAIANPRAAKLADENGMPIVKNSAGSSNEVPIKPQIEAVLEIMPNIKRLGTLYNHSEINSVSGIENLKNYLKNTDIELVEAAVTNTNDVVDAFNSLIGKVDAVYIGFDNTVVSALEGVIQAAEENAIPVFSADMDSVKRGTVAAAGVDYYEAGLISAKQVIQILDGAVPETIPVAPIPKLKLIVNLKAAEKMKVKIPEQVLQKADFIIQ